MAVDNFNDFFSRMAVAVKIFESERLLMLQQLFDAFKVIKHQCVTSAFQRLNPLCFLSYRDAPLVQHVGFLLNSTGVSDYAI